MMVDLAVFADEKYDAKAWLNAACRGRLPDDPVDRYLTDLEMKLQLMAETITADLDEQSTGALLRVPRASRDVMRVRDDAIALRSTVSAILTKLTEAEGTSAESVAALARVDSVKQRMEAAHETLQDAAGLAKLSASVEEVFASGDLPKAAETLANMRRCLAVVGEVPEFANVKRQLEVLEDRLEAMVQPRLADALTQRKVDSTQGLRDILIRIGRYSSLEQHYTRVRVRPLRRLWEEFESAKGGLPRAKYSSNDQQLDAVILQSNDSVSFAEWLPKFYDDALVQLEQELKWCTIAFPEDYKLLVPKLVIETMSVISSSFSARIDTASEEVTFGDQTASERSRLGAIIALHSVTGEFVKNLQHLLSGFEISEVVRVLKAVYSPYEASKRRYGELERTQLLAEITKMDLRGAVSRSVGQRGVELSETVGRMDSSLPHLIALLEAAVDRCLSFTGGSEVEALLRSLDEVMLQYLASLMEMLKSLRPLCGLDRPLQDNKKDSTVDASAGRKEGAIAGGGITDVVPEEEEWAIVQGALQFLTVADTLSARSSVFEASLRAVLTKISARLQLSPHLSSANQPSTHNVETETMGSGPGPLDMAVQRLADSPEKGQRLANLLEQAKDPRFHALPQTSQRVSAFLEAVNELVYEVLISKVRSKLTDVAHMPVWSPEEEDNAFDLPNFSAYPLPYVTSIGEYLFTLPQQLEPLASGTGGMAGDDNADDAQYIATEWMFKVAEGATALYIDQIRGIQLLNERGARQLSADIEYLCNVLSALSMSTPVVLSTFQTCVAAPRDKLPALAKQPGLDNASFRLVCKMRQLPVD